MAVGNCHSPDRAACPILARIRLSARLRLHPQAATVGEPYAALHWHGSGRRIAVAGRFARQGGRMGDGRETGKTDFFEELREQLRYWPYTIHQIDDTLDMSLIEGKGKQLLFQAVNSRNLTAFVGSGFSAGFGRLSWREWQSLQLDVVWRTAECFEALIGEAQTALARSLFVVDPDLLE